jgi:hypothetical protein
MTVGRRSEAVISTGCRRRKPQKSERGQNYFSPSTATLLPSFLSPAIKFDTRSSAEVIPQTIGRLTFVPSLLMAINAYRLIAP